MSFKKRVLQSAAYPGLRSTIIGRARSVRAREESSFNGTDWPATHRTRVLVRCAHSIPLGVVHESSSTRK